MKKIELTKEKLEYCKKKIENGIKDIVKESNSKGVVVALSGGLDSAVVLKLASGVVDTYALIMPEMGVNEPTDIKDAEDLANSLGVKYSIIEISDVINSIRKAFPWVKFEERDRKISDANIKPRTRMIFNYLIANLDKRIVLGTGNRTELLLGYVTKYGDSACDFEPIGDLYKTQVIQLARYLELPEKIIEKIPSAGLWKGQTDEGELGAIYRDIDRILYLIVDRDYSTDETAHELDLNIELVSNIHSRIKASEHKRVMPEIVKLNL